jgi:hypothetical protein
VPRFKKNKHFTKLRPAKKNKINRANQVGSISSHPLSFLLKGSKKRHLINTGPVVLLLLFGFFMDFDRVDRYIFIF